MALLAIVLWSLYPVVWLLGIEGFNAIGSILKVFLFLILDFFVKIGFGFLLLTNRQALNEVVGWSQATRARSGRPEKQRPASAANLLRSAAARPVAAGTSRVVCWSLWRVGKKPGGG